MRKKKYTEKKERRQKKKIQKYGHFGPSAFLSKRPSAVSLTFGVSFFARTPKSYRKLCEKKTF